MTTGDSKSDFLSLAARRLSSGWVVLFYCCSLLIESHWPIRLTISRTSGTIFATFLVHVLLVTPLTPMLAGFLGRVTSRVLSHPVWRDWLAVVIVPLVRTADELTRPWFGRSASVEGCLGDAAGFVVGVAILFAFRRLGRERSSGQQAAGPPPSVTRH